MIEGGCEKLETETKGHARQPGRDLKPGPALGGDLAMMKIKDYNHIGIVVRDLEKCKHFYGEILGLKTIFRPPFNFPGHWYQVGPGTQLHLMGYDETIPRTMRHAALEAYSGPPLDCPLAVTFTFYLPRPKGHFRTGKRAGELRDTAPAFPTGKPDVLKLARGVEDALTAIIYKDDSLIVSEHLYKRYTTASPGVQISIQETQP